MRCHSMLLATLLCGICVASALPQAPATTAATAKSTTASAKTPVDVQAVKPNIRDLPADTLRDFPGVCFASTTFRFYQVGDSWPLAPFCGVGSCLTDGVRLIERVRDCGLMPKENPKCQISNLADREQAYPACCPQFTCTDGAELEYPSPEELQLFAQQAHQAQLSAAAAQQQQLQRQPPQQQQLQRQQPQQPQQPQTVGKTPARG